MGETLRAEIKLLTENLNVPQVGDVIDAEIVIYPVAVTDDFPGEWILKSDFDQRLKVVRLVEFVRSENNPEVYTGKLTVVVKAPIRANEEVQMSFLQYPVNLKFDTDKNFQQLVKANQDFLVVETPWSAKNFQDTLKWISIGLILLVLTYWLAKWWKSWRLKGRHIEIEANEKKNLIKAIQEARSRSDFEILYGKKIKIDSFFANISVRKEFYKSIDLAQYRKDWDEQDLKKVVEYRDQLLKEINRGI